MSRHDPKHTDINVAIVGVGNCASSLVQGIAHYQNGGANEQIGLSHWDLGGYRPKDIRLVAAWDIDRRKVGRDVAEAIFEKPNCTAVNDTSGMTALRSACLKSTVLRRIPLARAVRM